MRALLENTPDRGQRPRLSRCLAARRRSAARMEGAGSGRLKSQLRPGVIAALVALVLDQASKLWLLFVFDIAHRGATRVTPFFDLVLAWNVGISFGWFQSESQLAQIALMVIKAVAVIVLAILIARSRTLLAAVALRPVICGGVRKALCPFGSWGGGGFVLFHVSIGGKKPHLYGFN